MEFQIFDFRFTNCTTGHPVDLWLLWYSPALVFSGICRRELLKPGRLPTGLSFLLFSWSLPCAFGRSCLRHSLSSFFWSRILDHEPSNFQLLFQAEDFPLLPPRCSKSASAHGQHTFCLSFRRKLWTHSEGVRQGPCPSHSRDHPCDLHHGPVVLCCPILPRSLISIWWTSEKRRLVNGHKPSNNWHLQEISLTHPSTWP